MLVQSVGQLLSGGLQLLPQGETVQHHSVLGWSDGSGVTEKWVRTRKCRPRWKIDNVETKTGLPLTHSSWRDLRMAGILVDDGAFGRIGCDTFGTKNELT